MPPFSQTDDDNLRKEQSCDLEYVNVSESRICNELPNDLALKRSHSISFNNDVEIFEIPNMSDLSDEEIGSLWYSRDEKDLIRYKCAMIVGRMDAGEVLDESRGLEMHTDSSLEKLRWVKSCAYEAVLGMQKFENFKGVALPDLMAELCHKCTASCQQEAHQRALRDASDVDLCR
jgi:hypothetical protein